MYISNARQLLQAFEQTQADMLLLDLEKCTSECLIEIEEMHTIFSETLAGLMKQKFNSNAQKRLLTGQLDRMLKILKELSGHMRELKANTDPDEKKIIFIFYRQHLFKNILKRHLNDYIRISGGSYSK